MNHKSNIINQPETSRDREAGTATYEPMGSQAFLVEGKTMENQRKYTVMTSDDKKIKTGISRFWDDPRKVIPLGYRISSVFNSPKLVKIYVDKN